MKRINRLLATVIVLAGITSSGCLHRHINNTKGFVAGGVPFLAYFTVNNFDYEWVGFWPMPVSPVLSYEIEDAIDRHTKAGVPILGPIKGEFAPIFCMDPPSEEEVYKTLKPLPHGVPFIYEKQRKNVRFSVEKVVDEVDECRFYPLAGPCQLHHCHFKCTIWWEETQWMGYPIPWTYTEKKQEVVYIDKDHLHRCGEPGNFAPASYGPAGYPSDAAMVPAVYRTAPSACAMAPEPRHMAPASCGMGHGACGTAPAVCAPGKICHH